MQRDKDIDKRGREGEKKRGEGEKERRGEGREGRKRWMR